MAGNPVRQLARSAVRSRAWRRTSTWIRGAAPRRAPAAGHELHGIDVPADVVVYFGDGAGKLYQLLQWLPVLERLHRTHRVLLVFRRLDALRAVRSRTTLPGLFVRRFADLIGLYDANDYALVVYVNNAVSNFQSLSHARPVHVHVNHGESDKISMVSNQAKAYDRVLIAGQAALERHRRALIDFDESRLVMVGRPQLDQVGDDATERLPGTTVMYAPTWEGENEANNYTSVDVLGEQLVEALLARPGTRVVYKPHPRVASSADPGVAGAHQRIVAAIEAADPDGAVGHRVSLQGDILTMFAAVDALVTDVSSVGLDFLYLHPDRPLVLTDRRGDREELVRSAPVARGCPVVDLATASVAELLETALTLDEHAGVRAELRTHYFGDHPPGSSTERFEAAVHELITERRRRLVGHETVVGTMEAAEE